MHRITLIIPQFFYSLLYPPLARVLIPRSLSLQSRHDLSSVANRTRLHSHDGARRGGPATNPVNPGYQSTTNPLEKLFVAALRRENLKSLSERTSLSLQPPRKGGGSGRWLGRLASLPACSPWCLANLTTLGPSVCSWRFSTQRHMIGYFDATGISWGGQPPLTPTVAFGWLI